MDLYPWRRFERDQRLAEVRQFFLSIASKYDAVEPRSYWAFSDEVLWRLLQQQLLQDLSHKKTVQILDAGAGTARWTIEILNVLPDSQATLFDISPEMITVAGTNISHHGLQDRCSLYVGDVEDKSHILGKKFDLVTCFHNVIGFNTDPIIAIQNLVEATADDGTLVLVLPNLYHAVYFSLQHNRMQELERIRNEYSVKYTDANPEVLLFTPQLIRNILNSFNFTEFEVLGFPISLYPAFRGDSALAIDCIGQDTTWNKLVECEVELCQESEAAARGKNLLVIAQRGGNHLSTL